MTSIRIVPLVLFAACGPTAERAASEDSSADGVVATAVSVTTQGSTASTTYTLATQGPLMFDAVLLAVRDASQQDFDIGWNADAAVSGSRTFNGSRTNLPPGTYTAQPAYTLDGTTWTNLYPMVGFSIDSPDANGLSVANIQVTGQGATASGTFTLASTSAVTLPELVLAVRDASNDDDDFMWNMNAVISGSRTFTGSHPNLATGVYTAQVAYRSIT